MSYPWWAYVLLFVVVGGAAAGGWLMFRQIKPHGTEDEYVERAQGRDPLEAVEGFTRRWASLQSNFMRRVALALVVLCAFIAAALGINVTLYAAQNEDDRQQAAQVQTNADIIDRLNADLKDRRERAARTDRQQCEDIERLKANVREDKIAARKIIRALTTISDADKQVLLQSSQDSAARFAPRRTTVNGRIFIGLDACGVLPNADGNP